MSELLHGCGLRWQMGSQPPYWQGLPAALSRQARLLGLSEQAAGQQDEAAFSLHSPDFGTISTRLETEAGGMTQAAISELSMQAASGILSVHGRSSGPSGTLGLDYLAVLSSAMSLQATLAAALGQLRGGRFSTVSVSPLGCGLLSIGQYLAGATAAQDPELLLAGSYDPGLRPPFISQDGVVFELETLDPRPWRAFWEAVGVPADLAGQAWKAFLLRYAKAVCPMPAACLSSLQTLNFGRLQELALQTGMAILPVRTPAQRQSDSDYAALAGLWQHQTHAAPGSLRTLPSNADLPLRGLRVVESCRRIQGPIAGHLLALLGAEVIRLEPPGGDPLRAMPPCVDGCSVRFDALNQFKTVQEVDIKSAQGRQAIYELVSESDVFLHNWAPGKAAELQLDAQDLHAVRPDLVYAYAGGWGQEQVDAPGTDFTVQAWSGIAHTISQTSDARGGSLFTVLDVLGGVMAALGISAALLRRGLSGSGLRVDSSLLATADHLAQTVSPISKTGVSAVFQTGEGFMVIDCQDQTHLHALAGWLNVSPDAVWTVLPDRLLSQSALSLEAQLDVLGIPARRVHSNLAQLRADPRLASHFHDKGYSSVNSPWRFL
ncbi:carnitine dehydratase [Alcaligenes faecalis]|uniref:CoA transferase n=1 Tax=Alcaligenes faecalis TaxID=511 RepID=UPI0005F91E48|nr:CoA transferase [Alcaligenes faecalis]ALO39892.1 carnitine dehydratase [Alcaligenes faecalis]